MTIAGAPTGAAVTDAFAVCVEHVLAQEGGYVNDPNDAGGETNYGISKRAYPHLAIRDLTRQQAIDIYRTDYWRACSCQCMPLPIALVVFDGAVNHGQGRMCEWLQLALGVHVDGEVGPATLHALEFIDQQRLVELLCGLRALGYMNTRGWQWSASGDGWRARLLATRRMALRLQKG